MKTLLESLRQYLAQTSPEKIAEDWAKSEHLKEVGCTVDEFLSSSFIRNVHCGSPFDEQQFPNINIGNKIETSYLRKNIEQR